MRKFLIILVAVSITLFKCTSNIDTGTTYPEVLEGVYLGMKPPGDDPELFAPGIVSSIYREHSGAVFSPDGKELFWSRAINEGREPRLIVILHMKQEKGKWTKPELAPFNISTYNHINSVSTDGRRLYFYSEEEGGSFNTLIVDKTDRGWGKPRPLRLTEIDNPGSIVNEVHETRSGNLYLSGPLNTMPNGRGIVRSKYNDGKYHDYESLGSTINMQFEDPYPNHSPVVDPDERFIIFVSRRPGGFGFQDLYISYRQSDDTWGPAINLGAKINTVGHSNSWPQLSPDGKYLFFTSTVRPYREEDIKGNKYSYTELIKIQKSILNGWGNIYWVNTSFIGKLKSEDNN